MVVPITVVVPLGPRAEDCAYLNQCFDSVSEQSAEVAQVLVIDDMHGVGSHEWCNPAWPDITVHRNPWNLGVAASFNTGVALAPTEHVLLLGADDFLEPDAIACAQAAIEANPYEQAYYYFRVRYSDGRADQDVPCGAAVVTKKLWAASGGFPIESAVGRSDVMLVGLLMGHPEIGTLVPILDGGTPPYQYRVHDQSHTASRYPWIAALESTAQAYWSTWQPPRWGRTA